MNLITFTEQVYRQVVAGPGTLSAGDYPATFIDASDFEKIVFVLDLGSTDQTAINMKVVQATAADGTGKKDVSGAAITQLGATDDNKQASIEVAVNKLDINNGFRYVGVTLSLSGGTATTGEIVAYGIRPGEAPVTQPTAFVEQVRVF